MNKLKENEYEKVINIISSQNELSVFSVIHGITKGEIYVNNDYNPTSALIKTSECNYITGNPHDEDFNYQIRSVLDFWDQLTPDSNDWLEVIPTIHPNSFIKKYKRRHYTLNVRDFNNIDNNLKEGYKLEKIDISLLRKNTCENSEKILDWIENFSTFENFDKHGTGYFIYKDDTIVSWSVSDCCYGKKIAIGIHTDNRFRKNGFGLSVVLATINDCFAKGYEKIDWLCVDSNKGSIAIAEKLGFTHQNDYYSFTSFPPIENVKDLNESEWFEWGKYLEESSIINDDLLLDSLYSYIKGNKVEETIRIMKTLKEKNITLKYTSINNYINILQTKGLCLNFTKKEWNNYL